MPLIKDGRIVDDPWRALSDDDPIPNEGAVIVSLQRLHADRERLRAFGLPLGVRLKSDEPAAAVADDVQNLSLIAVEFPSFRDGRGYSTARLLRERYGYRGELRAVGDVLRDQFLFMRRCGFDAFEVASLKAAESWSEAIREISIFYQPAADGAPTALLARRLRRAAE